MALTDNLEAYWTLDEASGTLLDSTANNVDSTVENGITYGATGILNDAVSFDGTDDYIGFGDVTALDFGAADPFSISCWVKIDATGENHVFACKQTAAIGWAFMYDSSDRLHFNLYNSAAPSDYLTVRKTGLSLSTGTWYHLVATYDGSTNASGVSLYVDGTAQTSLTLSDDTLDVYTGNSTAVQLGSYDANDLEGDLDEVGIWSREITSAEVTTLYGSGTPPAYPFTTSTNFQLNIGDAWKSVDAMQINIGDAWKSVAGAQINIGDAWKSIF